MSVFSHGSWRPRDYGRLLPRTRTRASNSYSISIENSENRFKVDWQDGKARRCSSPFKLPPGEA